MDVRRCFSIAVLLLILPLAPSRADDSIPSEVRLPLKDYLSLVETAERVDREKAEALAHQETPVAEVVSQRVVLTVGDDEVAVVSDFEVLLQGAALKPVLLPVAGFPEKVEIRDEAGRTGPALAAAVAAMDGGGGVLLAATQAGRYTIHVTGRAELGTGGGTGRVSLGIVAAPVASTEVDLPAELAWNSPGAVVVEEGVLNGRRRVRLATTRGVATVLDVRRKVDSAEADKLLAQSVVLTIVQLRPEGLRRHDIVLYEVKRGGLGRFTVTLPPGLEVEQAATDEGAVEPVVENGRLTVHRRHQLQGVGYLVVSSTPAGEISLEALKPEPEVRARYLAVSLAVAADVHPLPAASWARVDTSDLPAMLSDALTALDLAAAWRLATDGKENAKDVRLAVAPLPPAQLRDAVVRRRDTIALLTVDGTLLFRDSFLVDAHSRAGAALDVTLPAGGKLWSVKVDEQAVRPLDRGGVLSVPLGFNSGTRAMVEVISVQERALPPGRSQLAFDLPQVTAPVLVQNLRLLLPEGASYRFRRSELRWAPEVRLKTTGASFGESNVGGNETGKPAPAKPAPAPAADGWQVDGVVITDMAAIQASTDRFKKEITGLQQGLVGGVKPLPITIPESGKALVLSGVLPPAHVTVELDVKGKAKS